MNNKIRLFLIMSIFMFFIMTIQNAWGLTTAEREAISRELIQEISRQYGPVRGVNPDSEMAQIFRNLLRFTTPRQDIRYRLGIVESPVINAVTLPNGTILIFRGLLNALPAGNPGPLAFVLAHEIIHVEARHLDQMIARSRTTGTILDILTRRGGALTRLIGVLTYNLLVSGYSREAETESDIRGLALMERAGYNPVSSLYVVETLRRREQGRTRIFPTHPLTDDRRNNIVQWLRNRGYRVQALWDSSGVLITGLYHNSGFVQVDQDY